MMHCAESGGPTFFRSTAAHGAVALVATLVLTSCASDETPSGEDPAGASSASSPSGDATSATPTSTPTQSAPPTQAERWRASYEDNEAAYLAATRAALGRGVATTVITSAALHACNQLVDGRILVRRVAKVTRDLSTARTITPAQAIGFVDATVTYVCTDLATLHRSQVDAAARAARRAEQARRREAAAAARRRAEQQRREQPAPAPAPVSYANCTEVEAAGAAPIYAGDPGYSRDLDRDGDGVACET